MAKSFPDKVEQTNLWQFANWLRAKNQGFSENNRINSSKYASISSSVNRKVLGVGGVFAGIAVGLLVLTGPIAFLGSIIVLGLVGWLIGNVGGWLLGKFGGKLLSIGLSGIEYAARALAYPWQALKSGLSNAASAIKKAIPGIEDIKAAANDVKNWFNKLLGRNKPTTTPASTTGKTRKPLTASQILGTGDDTKHASVDLSAEVGAGNDGAPLVSLSQEKAQSSSHTTAAMQDLLGTANPVGGPEPLQPTRSSSLDFLSTPVNQSGLPEPIFSSGGEALASVTRTSVASSSPSDQPIAQVSRLGDEAATSESVASTSSTQSTGSNAAAGQSYQPIASITRQTLTTGATHPSPSNDDDLLARASEVLGRDFGTDAAPTPVASIRKAP